jgi:hypothetical protein
LATYFLLRKDLRKDLRKEILFSSFCFSALAFAELIFREYWKPKSLFGLVENYGLGVESFLLCFFLGGISASLWEFMFYKKERTLNYKIQNHYILSVGAIILTLMTLLEFYFRNYTIYTSTSLIFIIVFGGIYFFRKDLDLYIIESAFVFTILYIMVLLILVPVNYFDRFYNYEYLTGIKVLWIPIEEYVFGFAVGVLGSFLYKFIYDKEVL